MKLTQELIKFSLDDLDEYTSRSELARKLGTSKITIQIYNKMASKNIRDYHNSFPKVDGKVGELEDTMPLKRYQCYVIAKLLTKACTLGKKGLEAMLQSDKEFADEFSYSKFLEVYSNKKVAA
ncbi:hypothetical protein [Fischerella sp. PCC 9605]|uniref:hypothetical protein n=1 Tax=Fischerella sp. PCC 9605 TaxID=1173024 RepID=UPI00047EA6FF|nr:hypothetical protein [Fischerella sp. PCC 9605]